MYLMLMIPGLRYTLHWILKYLHYTILYAKYWYIWHSLPHPAYDWRWSTSIFSVVTSVPIQCQDVYHYKFNNSHTQKSTVTFCRCVVILVWLVEKCLLELVERGFPAQSVEALVHSVVLVLQLATLVYHIALTSWELGKQSNHTRWMGHRTVNSYVEHIHGKYKTQ